MKKNERKIIRMFAELSLKKRKRVIDVLYRMQTENKNMYDVSKQSLKERDDALAQLDSLCNDDGTRGDCELNPQVTKEQLDCELDDYMSGDPRLFSSKKLYFPFKPISFSII